MATKRELIVVATIISRMIGTPVFSDRTEFSVTTAKVTALTNRPVATGTKMIERGDRSTFKTSS